MHLIKDLQNYEAKNDKTKQRNRSIQNTEDSMTLLSVSNKTIRQKKSKYIKDLKNTINSLNLFGMYRTLHLLSEEYTFFLNAHGTFTKVHVDHILGPKTSCLHLKWLRFNRIFFLTTTDLKKNSATQIYLENLQVFGTYFK